MQTDCLSHVRPLEQIGRLVWMSVSGHRGRRLNPGNSMLSPWARDFICIASVDSAVKWIPGGDNLVKDVQCYELVGGIALKNHAFSFFCHFHVRAFARKLVMFCSRQEKLDFTHFPSMSIKSPASTEAYVSVITDLREEFTRSFQDFSTHSSKLDVFTKPFSVSPEDSDAAFQMWQDEI